MKKTSIGIILALLFCTLGLSSAALAEKDVIKELPNWHLEIQLKPYKPQVSKNETKQSFYNLMYGESEPIMTTLATHHYVWDGFGLLGVGGSVGYWKTKGSTRICTDDANNNVPCYGQGIDVITNESTAGNSSTQLMIVPVSLEVVYECGNPVDKFIKSAWQNHKQFRRFVLLALAFLDEQR